MAPLTPAGIKSAFSGTPENKAGFQAKTREINHKFLLHLPETGTLPELKAGLKNAKEHLLEQVGVCLRAALVCMYSTHVLLCMLLWNGVQRTSPLVPHISCSK